MSSTKLRSSDPELRLAWWLSWLFHPFIVAMPTMLLVIYLATSSTTEALKWTAVSTGFVIVPATLYILRKLRRGEYTDANVSVRQQRYDIYLFGGACLIVCLIVLVVSGAPAVLLNCFYGAILAAAVATIVNRVWKISAHAAAIGSCTAVLFWAGSEARGIIGIIMVAISLAVGWARVHTASHTTGQVVAGWLVGAASITTAFWLFG